MPEPLTAESIIEAAEEVLRRYGPAKTTVVDVARALDVSHGSVYRHFPSKAALRDAVTRRWLDRISAPLEEVVADDGDPAERLRAWVRLLAATKQGIAREDPELFATFRKVTDEAREVVGAHVDHLAGQLARIVQDGVADGVFASDDPQVDRSSRAAGHGAVPPPGPRRRVGRPCTRPTSSRPCSTCSSTGCGLAAEAVGSPHAPQNQMSRRNGVR